MDKSGQSGYWIMSDSLSLYLSLKSTLMLFNAFAISDHQLGLLPLVLGPPAADFCLSLSWCQKVCSCPPQTSWWVGQLWGPDRPSYTLWDSMITSDTPLLLGLTWRCSSQRLIYKQILQVSNYRMPPPHTWIVALVKTAGPRKLLFQCKKGISKEIHLFLCLLLVEVKNVQRQIYYI